MTFGAVRMCARATLRRRTWGMVAVTLLAGLAGGAVLAAFAGARRTEVAYPQLLDRVHAADVLVLPRQYENVHAAAIAKLPHVVQATSVGGYGLAARRSDGTTNFEGPAGISSEDGVALYDIQSFDVLEGRLPRPTRVHETALNEFAAHRLGLRLGDRYRALVFNTTAVFNLPERATPAERAALLKPIDLRVVGIGRAADDLLTNANQDTATAMLTPAFARRFVAQKSYGAIAVQLRDPDRDLASFEAALRRRYPHVQFDVRTRAELAATFGRAVRPYVDALRLFALVAAIAGIFVVGQALVRLVTVDSADGDTLRALGQTREQRGAIAFARALLAAVLGGVLAVVVAVAASPLFPLGPARAAELHVGVHLDGVVLAAGYAAMVVALLAPVAFVAWRMTRRVNRDELAGQAGWRTSRTAERLARAGAPASAVSGVRFALQRDRATLGASLLSTIIGLVVAVATITAAFTFGTSLDRLVREPARYGWTWDALIDNYDSGFSAAQLARIQGDRRASGVTIGSRATVVIAGRLTSGFGLQRVRGHALLEVTEGRFPAGADEVAMGAETLRALDRSVGDTVMARRADGSPTRLRIVGRMLFPSLSLFGTFGISQGVALTDAGVRRLDPRADPSFVLVDFAPGVTLRAWNRHRDVGTARGPQRPGDIDAYDRVHSTPLALAALLAILGVGVLVHVLVTSVRARRRDLAILKTIGFAKRQVSASVAWQASTLVAIALAIGVPVGLAFGRWTWQRFADNLGLSAGVVVPVATLAVVVVVATLLANLIAAVPARTAARTQAALVLRSE